jgi:hypothetical protein
MEGISYTRTLELIEKFMIDSHIRKYCSEICKGKCCESCYTKNPDSCRHQEGRRLPCSVFICSDMFYLFPATDAKFLKWLNKSIKDQYFIYRRIRCAYPNIYFTKPDTIFLKTVRFPKKIENVVGDLNMINIKSMMDGLIKEKIKIHEAYSYKLRRNLRTTKN